MQGTEVLEILPVLLFSGGNGVRKWQRSWEAARRSLASDSGGSLSLLLHTRALQRRRPRARHSWGAPNPLSSVTRTTKERQKLPREPCLPVSPPKEIRGNTLKPQKAPPMKAPFPSSAGRAAGGSRSLRDAPLSEVASFGPQAPLPFWTETPTTCNRHPPPSKKEAQAEEPSKGPAVMGSSARPASPRGALALSLSGRLWGDVGRERRAGGACCSWAGRRGGSAGGRAAKQRGREREGGSEGGRGVGGGVRAGLTVGSWGRRAG